MTGRLAYYTHVSINRACAYMRNLGISTIGALSLSPPVILVFAFFTCSANASERVWNCDIGRNAESKVSTRLKQQEAIQLAKVAAKKEGRDLEKFRYSSACFSGSLKDGSWTIFFEGLAPKPGNHFLVFVKDSTGATQLMPGE